MASTANTTTSSNQSPKRPPAWSLEQIHANANEWSLEGDAQLLDMMRNISQNLERRCRTTTANINGMTSDLDRIGFRLENTVNKMLSLKNVQFIEARVQDDVVSAQAMAPATEGASAAAAAPVSDPNMLAVRTALDNGLNMLNRCYEKVTLKLDDESDDDDADETNVIFRAQNPHQDRPLPYLIGSQLWTDKWHVGLIESDNEDADEDADGEQRSPNRERGTASRDDEFSSSSSSSDEMVSMSVSVASASLPVSGSENSDSRRSTRPSTTNSAADEREPHAFDMFRPNAEPIVATTLPKVNRKPGNIFDSDSSDSTDDFCDATAPPPTNAAAVHPKATTTVPIPAARSNAQRIKVLPTLPSLSANNSSAAASRTAVVVAPARPADEPSPMFKQPVPTKQLPAARSFGLFDDEPPVLDDSDSDQEATQPSRTVKRPTKIRNVFDSTDDEEVEAEERVDRVVKPVTPAVASMAQPIASGPTIIGTWFDDSPPDDLFDVLIKKKTLEKKTFEKTVLFSSDSEDDFLDIRTTAKKPSLFADREKDIEKDVVPTIQTVNLPEEKILAKTVAIPADVKALPTLTLSANSANNSSASASQTATVAAAPPPRPINILLEDSDSDQHAMPPAVVPTITTDNVPVEKKFANTALVSDRQDDLFNSRADAQRPQGASNFAASSKDVQSDKTSNDALKKSTSLFSDEDENEDDLFATSAVLKDKNVLEKSSSLEKTTSSSVFDSIFNDQPPEDDSISSRSVQPTNATISAPTSATDLWSETPAKTSAAPFDDDFDDDPTSNVTSEPLPAERKQQERPKTTAVNIFDSMFDDEPPEDDFSSIFAKPKPTLSVSVGQKTTLFVDSGEESADELLATVQTTENAESSLFAEEPEEPPSEAAASSSPEQYANFLAAGATDDNGTTKLIEHRRPFVSYLDNKNSPSFDDWSSASKGTTDVTVVADATVVTDATVVADVDARADIVEKEASQSKSTDEDHAQMPTDDGPNLNEWKTAASSPFLFDDEPPEDDFLSKQSNLPTPKVTQPMNAAFLDALPPDDEDFFGASANTQSARVSSNALFDDQPPEDDEDHTFAVKSPQQPSVVSSANPLPLFEDLPPDDIGIASSANTQKPTTSSPGKKLYYEDFSETVVSSPRDDGNKTETAAQDSNLAEEVEAPAKPKPKKLNSTLQINVAALLPGAKRAPASSRTITPMTTNTTEEDVPDRAIPINAAIPEDSHGLLVGLNKTRAKIPIKRRPSTRQGRQNEYRKSLLVDSSDVNVLASSAANRESSDEPLASHSAPSKSIAQMLQSDNEDINDWLLPAAASKESAPQPSISTSIPSVKPQPSQSAPKNVVNLFSDDDDDDDLFRPISAKKAQPSAFEKTSSRNVPTPQVPLKSDSTKVIVKKSTLFGDTDDDDDDNDGDLFGGRSQRLRSNHAPPPTLPAKERATAAKPSITPASSDPLADLMKNI